MRLRADLKFGTITDNPLAIGATTINSAQFATLPTVAGSDELYLTLDPEGSNREIVRVTAHAAAATVVTVQRGQLGTAAAQHALTTRWVHGIITTDLVVPCTSTTRPTLGLWAGMRIFEEDTKREYAWDGAAWVYLGGGDPILHSFRAHRVADHPIAAGPAWSTIFFDTEDYDPNNNYDPTTGAYTAPVTGTYDWASTCTALLNNNPQRFRIALHKNGNEHQWGTSYHIRGGATNDEWTLHGSGFVRLAAGDTAAIKVYNGEANACSLAENSQQTWFQMARRL